MAGWGGCSHMGDQNEASLCFMTSSLGNPRSLVLHALLFFRWRMVVATPRTHMPVNLLILPTESPAQ